MAAIWVMCDHFGLSRLVGMHYGFLAVRFMLVLSAYFAAKQLRVLWAGGPPASTAETTSKLVHYYATRVIRLGLLTYVVIALALLFNMDGARSSWGWHLAFATNHYIASHGEWPGVLSHFWSLAVQMQFLLFLPLVFILLSRKGLWLVLATGIGAAVLHRISVVTGDAGDLYRWMPLANSLDAFCMGIGLAWVERERPQWFAKLRHVWVAIVALAVLIMAHRLRGASYSTPLGTLTETLEAVALTLFFGALLAGRLFGPIGALLRSKPLVFFGGASLSIYAFHPLAHQMLSRWCTALGVSTATVAFQWGAVGLSLLVAWGGYHLLEIPARRFSAAVEPVLSRSLTQWAERRQRRRAFGWRWQPYSAVAAMALLLYTAILPVWITDPNLIMGEGGVLPYAAEEMEESLDDLPSLYLLEHPEVLILDEMLHTRMG